MSSIQDVPFKDNRVGSNIPGRLCHRHSELPNLSKTIHIRWFWAGSIGGHRCQGHVFTSLALRWRLNLSLFTFFHYLAVPLLVTRTLFGSPFHHLVILLESIRQL